LNSNVLYIFKLKILLSKEISVVFCQGVLLEGILAMKIAIIVQRTIQKLLIMYKRKFC